MPSDLKLVQRIRYREIDHVDPVQPIEDEPIPVAPTPLPVEPWTPSSFKLVTSGQADEAIPVAPTLLSMKPWTPGPFKLAASVQVGEPISVDADDDDSILDPPCWSPCTPFMVQSPVLAM
jgi:hypothetical protein